MPGRSKSRIRSVAALILQSGVDLAYTACGACNCAMRRDACSLPNEEKQAALHKSAAQLDDAADAVGNMVKQLEFRSGRGFRLDGTVRRCVSFRSLHDCKLGAGKTKVLTGLRAACFQASVRSRWFFADAFRRRADACPRAAPTGPLAVGNTQARSTRGP